jgi:hypothetical protein
VRVLGWLSLAALLGGCSPGAPQKVGVSPRAAPAFRAPANEAASTTRARPPPAEFPWDLSRQLPTLRPVTPPATSEHLTGELDGEVLANEAARPYPALGPRFALAPGATLVERHLTRGLTEATVVYFAMVKRPAGYDPQGDDWEYLVVAPDGQVEARGRLPLCGRCHADAPHAHLFGAGR